MDNHSASVCTPAADADFGPIVSQHCRGGFDFTLVFEQSIFVLVPGCIMILVAPFRLAVLLKRPHQVQPGKLRVAKLVSPLFPCGAIRATININDSISAHVEEARDF